MEQAFDPFGQTTFHKLYPFQTQVNGKKLEQNPFNYQPPTWSYSGSQDDSRLTFIGQKLDKPAPQANNTKNSPKNLVSRHLPDQNQLNFGRRNYDPNNGIFTSQDPVTQGQGGCYDIFARNSQVGENHQNTLGGNLFNPSSQHDYGLVQNNPMGGKDVDGYYSCTGAGCKTNSPIGKLPGGGHVPKELSDRFMRTEKTNQEKSFAHPLF